MNNDLIALFSYVAPEYDPQPMIALLHKKLASKNSADLDIMIAEFVKFMFLRSSYGKGFIPLKGDIDDVWHEYILQTMEYEKFCLSLPGKKFIHHISLHLEEFSEGKDKKTVIRDLLLWLPNYYRHFGAFTAETADYWMIVGFLQKELGWSLDEVNQFAKQA